MTSGTVLLGAVLALLFGVPAALRPYPVAKLNEQLDAVGSTRSSGAVEPTDWKVTATRAGGVLLTAVGLALLAVA